jgi:hypothetical protein
MPPDWEGNGGCVAKRDISEHLRTIWRGETEGKELLFSSLLPYLLRDIPTSHLVGGDFNIVITNMFTTVHPNYSRPMQELFRGFHLVDMWKTPQWHATYTHYTIRGIAD